MNEVAPSADTIEDVAGHRSVNDHGVGLDLVEQLGEPCPEVVAILGAAAAAVHGDCDDTTNGDSEKAEREVLPGCPSNVGDDGEPMRLVVRADRAVGPGVQNTLVRWHRAVEGEVGRDQAGVTGEGVQVALRPLRDVGELAVGDVEVKECPLDLRVLAVRVNRMLGAFYQSRGCNVVPTARWCTSRDWPFCFLGIEQRSAVSVSNHGLWRDRDLRQGFVSGLHEMIERIDPPVIFLHGTVSA